MVPVRLGGQYGHVGQPQERGCDVEGSGGRGVVVPHVEDPRVIVGHPRADVTQTGAQHVHEAVLVAQRSVHQDGQ